MKTWVRKTLSVGILAAGALLFAPGAAHAGGHGNGFAQVTGANNGILNGTQIGVPINIPINVCGNSLAILGGAGATGVCTNERGESARDVQATGANNGILNGTQVLVPINVPVNAVGNSAAVLGAANATGVGANEVSGRKTESAHTTEGTQGWGPGFAQVTGANNGILNGTQIGVPINVPINVCGNSLALLGAADSRAICSNESVFGHRGKGWKRESAHVTEGAQGGPDFLQATGVNNGILNGTQIGVPINIPINVCGNSLGVLGQANSAALCANEVDNDGWGLGGGHVVGGGNGGHGHGHGGHGNGGQNAGDNGDNGGVSYLGDNGSKPGNGGGDSGYGNGAGNGGYGNGSGAGNGGYSHGGGATKPATGSSSDSTGGRESLPVGSLTNSVGGLGLLDSLH